MCDTSEQFVALFLRYFIFMNNHSKEHKMLKNDPLLTFINFNMCNGNAGKLFFIISFVFILIFHYYFYFY